jgi:sugar lactone lactonase YvrE
MTVGGPGMKIAGATLPDLFGVAVDGDNRIYFSDGTGDKIWRIEADGSLRAFQYNLHTPSGLAFKPGGWRPADAGALYIADTGAHIIVVVDIKLGRGVYLAGVPGKSGYADGDASKALFNGPVGVAVNKEGVVFVADTYNDRIRAIENGIVRTIAGGNAPGYRDGRGAEAQFDTPCGIAVGPDGSLLVADTGNHRIRHVTLDGEVTTIAGAGERGNRDGKPLEAGFSEPIGIATRRDGTIFVTCAGEPGIRAIDLKQQTVTTVAGGYPTGPGGGLGDGEINKARLNRPSSLAFTSNDDLVFSDTANGLIRALVPQGRSYGFRSEFGAGALKAPDIRKAVPPRWPYDPPQAKRDVAGTFGEIRGELLPDHDAWFHNGLDIPGAYGETARAIFSERVTQPLAVEGAGGTRERLRLPLIGYIHVRVGRDQRDQPIGPFPSGAVTFLRDEQGQIARVRVRRGTAINAGDPIGTLNKMNHVHLIAGPYGSESNALAALQFPGLIDHVAPTIESVAIASEGGETVFDSLKTPKGPKLNLTATLPGGRYRILVRAYDQVDGNPTYRRLGVYRLGYQLLRPDGSPVAGFERPKYNVIFEQLPRDSSQVKVVYAEGSQSGYQGQTIFSYVVTNVAHDGEAREDFLDTTPLDPGDYTVRVFAEDFFGNQARRDSPVVVVKNR